MLLIIAVAAPAFRIRVDLNPFGVTVHERERLHLLKPQRPIGSALLSTKRFEIPAVGNDAERNLYGKKEFAPGKTADGPLPSGLAPAELLAPLRSQP